MTEIVDLDLDGLRALAHPLRLRLLDVLRDTGPATATMLGQRLGESSGATSYHLRSLHRHGFVEDDPGRGHGRERWWKATRRTVRASTAPSTGPEYRAAVARVLAVVLERDARALTVHLEREETDEEWRAATLISGVRLHLTAAEATKLGSDVMALIERYDRPEPSQRPAAARFVHVTVRLLPVEPI